MGGEITENAESVQAKEMLHQDAHREHSKDALNWDEPTRRPTQAAHPTAEKAIGFCRGPTGTLESYGSEVP